MNTINRVLDFENNQIDSSIINKEQIKYLISHLLKSIENNIEGDVVEFGCYVGESSKYLMKTLVETNSKKNLYVYDSFEGLPPLSKWEEGTGWKPYTLKTTEQILISNFEKNNLPIPIITKNWFKDIPDSKIPDKISFAFLDGDFYDSIYDSLNKIFDKVTNGGYICFHDYNRNDLPGVKAAIEDFFKNKNIEYKIYEVCEQLGVYKKISTLEKKVNNNGVTIVTGIWDIKRDSLNHGWNRNFEHYLNNLAKLMKVDDNMIIFIESKYRKFVEDNRSKVNTLIIERDLDWFKKNIEIYDNIQKIRNKKEWYNQSGWLSESTQAKLPMYNPIVMSKMFLLNDAAILDKFNSSHLVWIDGALTNTVHEGYFWKDNVINKLKNYFNKFSFVCFPYDGKVEIHGFTYKNICDYSKSNVDKVARGGIFGGPKSSITKINAIYYDLLYQTLNEGLMGTEESIFTIMTYRYPELIQYYEINSDGLLGTFFENLKNDKLKTKEEGGFFKNQNNSYYTNNCALYVLTFNSPEQFEKLCLSFKSYDDNFLNKTKKYLINNSTKSETFKDYEKLCREYDFLEIRKNNIGICGGRQYIAEHAEENNFDYYFFFEDDMFFYLGDEKYCRNGFPRKIDQFYNKIMKIIQNENFDFLKWNFTELFGDNSRQWAWYNVPQEFREKQFPDHAIKSENDSGKEPFMKYKNIKSLDGLAYATGEIYYCNWPQTVSREGNKKMFLNTRWTHPYEQTWMSYIYQETIKGNIKPGILLATPTEHDRFVFYPKEERREN